MDDDAVLRLGRNQVLAGIVVIAVSIHYGYVTGTAAADLGTFLGFFLVVTFAGFVVGVVADLGAEYLFWFSVTRSGRFKPKSMQEMTEQLVAVIRQDPTLSSFIAGKPRHSWKLAGRFLSQTREMGFSPMEDLERCASFTLAGLSSAVIGSFLLGTNPALFSAEPRSLPLTLIVDVALFMVGLGLSIAGRAEATNFVEGTLAGMRERLRALQTSQEAGKQAETRIEPERVNRMLGEISTMVVNLTATENLRLIDAQRLQILMQETRNVDTVSVDSVRGVLVRVFAHLPEETNDEARMYVLYSLTFVLRQCSDAKAYEDIERSLADQIASLAKSCIGAAMTPLGSAYIQALKLMESPSIADAILAVLKDTPTVGLFPTLLDALSNSHLGDCNEERVVSAIREVSESRREITNYLPQAFSNLDRRRNAPVGNLDDVPQVVRMGRIPRTGFRTERA